MNEYINKTKFLEHLRQELSEIDTIHHDHINLEKQMYEFAVKKAEEMESEDVEIVKHGHWIAHFGLTTWYECSECHECISEEPHYNYSEDIMNFPKYCEHCGARMEYVISTNNNKPIKYICDDSKIVSDDEGNITITRKMSPVEIAETFDIPLNDVLNGKARLGLCIEE